MNIKDSKKNHIESGPNLTPLVDVVMVIQIFLMLAGSFVGADNYLQSKMPVHKGVNVPTNDPPSMVTDRTLDIMVDARGSAHEDYVATVGSYHGNDGDKLAEAIGRMRQGMLNAGINEDQIQVVINPGRNVKYKFLVQVFQAANVAKFTKIGFGTSH